MQTLHAIVSGLVQGVGFRYFVNREAEALGLSGYVKNLDTGEVEVLAEGEKEKLKTLLAKLHIGPRSAHVRNVRVNWTDQPSQYSGFQILGW